MKDDFWKLAAICLYTNTTMSRREIARELKVPRSTCLDLLRKYSEFLGSNVRSVRASI